MSEEKEKSNKTEFILGKKVGMSQIFDEDKNVIPVTVIKAGPCFVTQLRSDKIDGYEAIQVGFEKLSKKKTKKPQKNKDYRYLREFPVSHKKSKDGQYVVGDKITVDMFEKGNIVKVAGISKGKGFQGGVKRHGFSGGPATHGHRHVLRTIGSIGSAFPERVLKGKKMPGHAGAQKTTVSGLEVVSIDKKNNLLALRGAVPGPNKGLLEISLLN